MATANLGMDLPVVGTDAGPGWATKLLTALGLIDAHDHTSGKGALIPAAGLALTGEYDVYKARGAALLGLTSYGTFWEDFARGDTSAVPPGFVASADGTSARLLGVSGGVSRRSTSATASKNADDYVHMNVFTNAATKKWYYATRFAVSTAVDAQAKVMQGFSAVGSGNSVLIGVHGPSSTANFGFICDGNLTAATFTSLGLAVDTAFHIFEMWCVGDNVVHARVDGGTIVTATQGVVSDDDYLMYHFTRNGTTAANRAQDRDWCLSIFPR